jgi:pimeloyl-ACP methyl ester carboxylesterase
MTERSVCFSHGKESGPWGTKIEVLAELARAAGWAVDSLDYRGMEDPQARVDLLSSWCAAATSPYALVGSSMGGHVAAAAAVRAPPLGLFLMAPAFFMPGFEAHTPPYPDCPVTIVHGWHDEIVPWQNSVRFGESGGADVILLDSDHRLTDVLVEVGRYFQNFLATLSDLIQERNDV